MEKGLVSVIIPCYNGEKYVPRILESILGQDYPYIEVIIVDDCSTDLSYKIACSYKVKFEDAGYKLIVIKQDNNKGAAAAINIGLQIYSGEYLLWMDCDDIMLPDNVSLKVKFLEGHKEVGFVLGQGILVDETNLNKPIGYLKREPEEPDNLFEDLIKEHNVVFGPGVIGCRRSAIETAIPSNHIYESREGQNWQLMLPLAYMFKCGYINRPVFKCVIHNDSHSRRQRTYQGIINRYYGFTDLLTYTIERIPTITSDEIIYWEQYVRTKYLYAAMQLSLNNLRIRDYKKYRHKLQQAGYRFSFSENIAGYYTVKILKKIRDLVKYRKKTASERLSGE